MRLNGHKFIPGIRIEVQEDEPKAAGGVKENGVSDCDHAIVNCDIVDKDVTVINGKNGESLKIQETPEDGNSNAGDEDDEDEETFQTISSFPLFPKREVREASPLHGTDWESVNYTLEKITCNEDEITGLEVTDKYIIVQYYIEPGIDVYDVETKEFMFRLDGHEYGGQCLQVSELTGLLYSASMDCSLKSWNLESKLISDSVTHHCDYVNSLVVSPISSDEGDLVATGGRGDKSIFVYHSTNSGKLERKHKLQGHSGWIIQMMIPARNNDGQQNLISGSEDATIRIWDLDSGDCVNVLEQDCGISCMITCPKKEFDDGRLIFFGDQDGKLSYLDLESEEVLHLLPNILIGTGKYCRSSKYHDKAVDTAHLTDNGYLITGSSGSTFVKIWKISQSESIESTEVKELQILRDHTDYLSIIKVRGNTIYSSCSDGHVYLHSFPPEGAQPHYEMAVDAETNSSTSVLLNRENRSMAADPEQSTEICEGPKRCRTGKTGLVKSSSSFQVSFQLKPSVCTVDTKIKIPTTSDRKIAEAILEVDEEEWEPTKDSDVDDSNSDDEYEIVYVTDDDDEDEQDSE